MRVSIMLLTVLVCVFSALGQDNSTQQNNSFTKSDSLRKNPDSFGNQSNTDKKRKFEVGIQFTSMMREGDGDRNGLGGRFGYDFATFNGGKYVATAEAELNFLPGDRFVGYSGFGIGSRRDGRVTQGFFGAKIGRRFDKFGIFGKVRPGFVQYSRGKQSLSGTTQNLQFSQSSETNFATDIGGVLEFYPTKRITTRFDAGDTIVRFGRRNTTGFDFFTQQTVPIILPKETKHNFQFSAGIGFRF